jgi:hypothetical protein
MRFFKLLGGLSLILFFSACATLEEGELEAPPVEQVGKFSDLNDGVHLPKAWQVWRITPQKNKTNYVLRKDQGKTVLHADANSAASGFVFELGVEGVKLYSRR